MEDGLKISSLLNVIGRIRTVVKKIRTQKYTSLFMDPRFQCLLNDSSKIEAKDHLQKTWRILELLLSNENEANTNNFKCNVAHEENVMDFDDDLESFIQSSSHTNENMSININSSLRSIGILLEEYDNVPRMHHSIDIKKYRTPRVYA
eukprot:XP_016659517.1 PREDICTED: uncharacterized protein LOC107883631 [Acyrthosiphon pisum]